MAGRSAGTRSRGTAPPISTPFLPAISESIFEENVTTFNPDLTEQFGVRAGIIGDVPEVAVPDDAGHNFAH